MHAPHPGKCTNPNCAFCHAQANELDAQYVENVCTVLALGMYYIWRHREEDILVLYSVGSKRKIDNWQQVRGGAKRQYGKARHEVEASHRGVSGNVGQLPCQGSSVVETRQNIYSWAANHEEKLWCMPTKPKEKV